MLNSLHDTGSGPPGSAPCKIIMAEEVKSSELIADKTSVNDKFIEIKKKHRKRKIDDVVTGFAEAMDTAESAPKRPNLPPISSEKLLVRGMEAK